MSCFKVGDMSPRDAIGRGTSVKKVPVKDPTKGGVQPDVLVQFRPSQKYLGKFGFDWLRLDDSGLSPAQSDVKYTENVGYHYGMRGNKVDKPYQMKSFKKNTSLSNKLKSSFQKEGSLTILSKKVSGLDKDFEYRMPVMTLMPKDNKLNPYNVNLVAKLDTLIHHGKKRAKSLRLAYKTDADEKAAKDVIVVNSMSLPTSSKKSAISITSKGILKKTVILYVYADKCHQPCGAVKILRNDKVKKVTAIYMGVQTNINKKINQKFVPSIDLTALRFKLGQALISVDIIISPKLLNMNNKFKTAHIVKIGKNNVLNFDAPLLSMLDAEFSRQSKALGLTIPRRDTFKLYFLGESCYSATWKMYTGGGGIVGGKSSFFLKTNGANPGVLAHEIGHNLGLRHTFSHKSYYTYQHKSTDNVMDYTHIDKIFYHWQWKMMNKGIK